MKCPEFNTCDDRQAGTCAVSRETSQTKVYLGAVAEECVQRIKWSPRAVSSWDFNSLQGCTKAWDPFLMKPEEHTKEVETHRTRLSSKHGPELPKHAALLHTRPSPSIQTTQQSSGKDWWQARPLKALKNLPGIYLGTRAK